MIPDFQKIMLPLLTTLGGGESIPVKNLREYMVQHFKISEEEQKEKTPSGRQYLYYNRVAWALSYLKMAELVESPERGVYKITKEGEGVLKNPPEKITIAFLKQFKNFDKNRNPNREEEVTTDDSEEQFVEKTPDELIEIGYMQIKNQLASKMLEKIKSCSPYFLEKLVVDLLLKMGYGGSELHNSEITPKGADEGIDGIIREDKLGLDKIYLQAKKWESSVGRPEIQKFVGALQGKRAKKGIFITTSVFTKEAVEYAKSIDVAVILIDGAKLAGYMIESELGVSLKSEYRLYSIDTDYFSEEE